MGDGVKIVAALDWALRVAGVPIDGVRIGRVNDKATWLVWFTNAATPAHRAAAQAVIGAFDADNLPAPAALTVEEKLASIDLTIADLKAALGK